MVGKTKLSTGISAEATIASDNGGRSRTISSRSLSVHFVLGCVSALEIQRRGSNQRLPEHGSSWNTGELLDLKMCFYSVDCCSSGLRCRGWSHHPQSVFTLSAARWFAWKHRQNWICCRRCAVLPWYLNRAASNKRCFRYKWNVFCVNDKRR